MGRYTLGGDLLYTGTMKGAALPSAKMGLFVASSGSTRRMTARRGGVDSTSEVLGPRKENPRKKRETTMLELGKELKKGKLRE